MSGSPLIQESTGKVIGIVSGSQQNGRSIGWAIPISYLDIIKPIDTPIGGTYWKTLSLYKSAFKGTTRSLSNGAIDQNRSLVDETVNDIRYYMELQKNLVYATQNLKQKASDITDLITRVQLRLETLAKPNVDSSTVILGILKETIKLSTKAIPELIQFENELKAQMTDFQRQRIKVNFHIKELNIKISNYNRAINKREYKPKVAKKYLIKIDEIMSQESELMRKYNPDSLKLELMKVELSREDFGAVLKRHGNPPSNGNKQQLNKSWAVWSGGIYPALSATMNDFSAAVSGLGDQLSNKAAQESIFFDNICSLSYGVFYD